MDPAAGVSAIVNAHASVRFVGEALESVMAQTVPAGEVLVVDNGPDDGTAAVVAAFPGVRHVRVANPHLGASRNRGIALSRGALLAFLDADDLWTPRKLEVQLRALEAAPALGAVFGAMEEFAAAGSGATARPGRHRAPLAPAMLARRSAFATVGVFREDRPLGEMLDWLLRAGEHGVAWEAVPDLVLRRRVHGGNLGRRDRSDRAGFVHTLKEALDRRRAGS